MLETELNGRNVIVAVNECVLPLITYSFGILSWLESELKEFDVQIRMLLNNSRVKKTETEKKPHLCSHLHNF